MATRFTSNRPRKSSRGFAALSPLSLLVCGALLCLWAAGCAGGSSEADAGSADSGVPGCKGADGIFSTHTCTTICHKAEFAVSNGGGFDMTSTGWQRKLVGNGPPDSAPMTNMCKGKGQIYLHAGVQPATGLFMDKIKPNPPCGVPMPMLLAPLSSSEIACIQMWANNVVAGGTGQ